MRKKSLTIAIIAIIAITSLLGVSYAVWLGDVDKDATFTIKMTDKLIYITSQDLIVEGNAILLPTSSVTHKFNLRVRGENIRVKLSCVSIEYSTDSGTTYKPAAANSIGVTFENSEIDTDGSANTDTLVACKSTISFLLNVDQLDPIYKNATIRYSIKVEIVNKEV